MSAVLSDFPLEASRQLPFSLEAEQAVLGGLMLANEMFPEVSGWLEPHHFFRHDHRAIYAAICELAQREQPFDFLTLGDHLRGSDVSPDYLTELSANIPGVANLVAYAEIIVERAGRRRVIEIGSGMVDEAFQPSAKTVDEIVGEASRSLSDMEPARRGGVMTANQVGKKWSQDFSERVEADGKPTGLLTPWSEFNRRTGGLMPAELIVVAGRPAMGKSAWAINLATCAALREPSPLRVLFFSLEMSAEQIFRRAIASISNVPLSWLKAPDRKNDECWAATVAAGRLLKASGLLIDDTPALAWPQIEARAQREARKAPLDLVIVDHLHIIPLPGKTRETVEIGHITAGGKKLSKQLSVPVILLSQLNRGLEGRVNKRPTLGDLRESGNIEQDADQIVFLYRDDYYAKQEGRPSQAPGVVEMNIAKFREGEPGPVYGTDELAFGRIADRHDQNLDIPEHATKKSGGMN